MTAPLRAYGLLSAVTSPLLRLWLCRRARQGREDQTRLPERRGLDVTPRPPGVVFWVHAASIGEAVSALPLIARLLAAHPESTVLQTTGTLSAARLMARRLPSGVRHRFVPLDHPAWVRRFLEHWRPDAALWLESELWPNLVRETAARHIPMMLINARLSRRSRQWWARVPRSAAGLLQRFQIILAQSEHDAAAFRALGGAQAIYVGNLKRAAPPLAVDPDALAALRRDAATRTLWLAASTHPGEEDAVAAIHRRLRATQPQALCVIAPRHPERGPAIAAQLQRAGWRTALRSRGDPLAADTAIYIADTLGEIGLFYRLAEVALIGGSLLGGVGGHNLLEAAWLDCAIVHGPDMANFSAIATEMQRCGAALPVATLDAAAATIIDLLADPETRHQRQQAALAYARQGATALDAIMEAVTPLLPPCPTARPA